VSTKATPRDLNVNGQTFQASLAPAIPVSSLVPMHVEDLKQPADPNNPPLTDDEVKMARDAGMINKTLVNAQFDSFRRMRQRRHYEEPNGQRFAVISWVPSTKGKPDPDNCYGLMRIGGCFSTQAEADRHAEKLLRTDSTRAFLVTYVGLDFPLTTDDFGVLKRDEIDLETKTEDIETQNQRHIAELEEQKAREIEDARDNLLKDVSKKRTADDLDSYIELCVKQAHSEAERSRALEQIEKCNRVVVATEPLLQHIIGLHPEYRELAAKSYASACQRVGIDPEQSVVSKYLDFERLKPHQAETSTDNVPRIEEDLGTLSLSSTQTPIEVVNAEDVIRSQAPPENQSDATDSQCICTDCPSGDSCSC
jgi:hypothetical protein